MATGRSTFILGANSSQFVGEVTKAEKSTDKLDKSQKQLGKTSDKTSESMAKLGAKFSKGRDAANKFAKAVGVTGIAMTAALVKSGLASADALAKTADKLGITTEKLAGLRHAAELTGTWLYSE